jgi:NAD+ diphosphatase
LPAADGDGIVTLPGFCGATIDRADHIRSSPDALADARAALSARLLRLNGIDPVIDDAGTLAWGSMAEADPAAELLFLGMSDGKPRWAALPPATARIDARSRSVWAVLGLLGPADMALYGGARSLIDWHHRHRFCAQCSAPTAMAKGGWQRDCGACGASHFPRVDPVTIMLAEQDGAVLIARQAGWPAGRFSALAGFVEPGESLEEAVLRELHEEAGIVCSDVRYVASQPWPFPSQLMIACIASAPHRDYVLDATELSDAMWVDRAQVQAALAGDDGAPFLAPPPYAIAHTLLSHWVNLEQV